MKRHERTQLDQTHSPLTKVPPVHLPTVPFVLDVPYSHLFRGLRLQGATGPKRPESHSLNQDAELVLKFSDGSQTTAELVRDRRDGIALSVAAYTTARGTSIPKRLWVVIELEMQDGQMNIRLGRRFPDPPDAQVPKSWSKFAIPQRNQVKPCASRFTSSAKR
ncbi:MAG: hypothetical protein IT331_15145 [Anaerolineae bacterium]|nr:hypothetical protein [Anaerolineae bacterium]